MKRTLRLRTYFTLVFVTFSVLASFTISLTIGLRSIGQIKGEIGVSLRSMAERMADRMTAYMAARDNEILLLSQVDTLRHMEDPARIAALLEQLQTAVPAYAWIGVLDRQGTVVAATRQSMAGTDLSQQPIFSGGLAGRYFGDLHEAVLLAPFVTTPSGAPLSVTDLGVPLLDDDGRVAGVLAAYLDWEWADMARASILETLQASRGIDMTVLRAQDQVAVLGPEAAIGQRVEVPVHLLTHRSGWFVDRWAGGASQVAGYAVEKGISGVSGFDRIVLVRQSTEIAYLGARQLLRDTILAGLGCSLLFVLLGWFVTRSIAAPIIAIARVTDRFRIEKSAKLPVYHGIAEIEQLHRSIGELLESLSKSKVALGEMDTVAHHDFLTGMPNRTGLERYLADAADIVTLKDSVLALLCLDLDGFKAINDTYGHETGDRVLVEVAQRITRTIRVGEIAARIGGDEFVVVLMSSPTDALRNAHITCQRIIETVCEPFPVADNILITGCSIGGTFWRNGLDMKESLRRADEALYESKRKGRNRATLLDNLSGDA